MFGRFLAAAVVAMVKLKAGLKPEPHIFDLPRDTSPSVAMSRIFAMSGPPEAVWVIALAKRSIAGGQGRQSNRCRFITVTV